MTSHGNQLDSTGPSSTSNPIRISAAGCCLVDYVYQRVSYDQPDFQKLVTQTPGDGGIIPGGLVFTEDLERYSGQSLGQVLDQVVGQATPDTVNLGGPAVIALANASQLLSGFGVESRFYGWIGDDGPGNKIQDFVQSAGIDGRFQVVSDHATPSTVVLSDPKANGGHGERSFLNTIGAAAIPRAQDLPEDFFQADLVLLGGTALTPGLHDDLTKILTKAKDRGCITVVGTVFDFRNEKLRPQEPWPLGQPDGCPFIDVLICDGVEAIRITGKEDLGQALKELIRRGAGTVIITNGEQDGLVGSSEGLFPPTQARAFKVHSRIGQILNTNPERFADTTGCGDNFLGGFLASLAWQKSRGEQLNLDQALAWAASSGGFACLYPGGLYQEPGPGEKRSQILPLVNQYLGNHLVQWGAGNIGRSFIGQIFARNGWQVTFVDVDSNLILQLNQAGGYKVIEVTDQSEQHIEIRGIRAIHGQDTEQVAQAVLHATMISISVGKQVLPKVLPDLAKHLADRYDHRPDEPIDLLIAENMTDGAEYVRSQLRQAMANLGRSDVPLDTYVGLIETSLGKMVPIQTSRDPLTLYAEPYNTLVVDRLGFLGPLPLIPQLMAVDPMKAWVVKKLYIHNLGHAAAAYLGYQAHPESTYLWEVLQDPLVKDRVRSAMDLGAQVVQHQFPGVFSTQELDDHIEDLIIRFQNRALGDTIYRVGRDVGRKLFWDDRIGGALLAAHGFGLRVDGLAQVFLAALDFKATDPVSGRLFPGDQELFNSLADLPKPEQIQRVLGTPLGYDSSTYQGLIQKLVQMS